MAKLPLGIEAYSRPFSGAPEIQCVNRFFEKNPANLEENIALLSRPGSIRKLVVGSGPIRRLFTLRGAFDNDLFVVSGDTLYRVDAATLALTTITGGIGGTGAPEITFVTGFDYERIWITDGNLLRYYDGTSAADGLLTLTPSSPPDIDGETISVDGVYYQWAADPTVGTPTGGSGDPFLVDIGASDQASLENMFAAINATGQAGITYSEEITAAHATVQAVAVDATTLRVRARVAGTGGNSIALTATGDVAWDDTTLSGGGVEKLQSVQTPDDIGIASVATLNSYVIAVAAFSRRWYYIQPGEIIIDPLNFYEAEQAPDDIQNVRTVGDELWFLKERNSEVWYATGTSEDPFRRTQGRAFTRGTLEGTGVVINDTIVLVDDANVVRDAGNGLRRLSNHGIEEVIRLAREQIRENT